MSEIQKGENKFYLGASESQPDAEIVYSDIQEKMVIEHTYVSEKLRGQGVGQKLVDEAVRYARENDIKIDSRCPFAKSVLEENEEYQDIMD
ncbi:GNAT family N-acetyltransferase [Bacillus sp. SCS-153A]|uniref:GNAT family N-acetyltransferase n=1 Tax=Rossellomorea sedimentorum TaxID=3115294 RepID=UPI003906226C